MECANLCLIIILCKASRVCVMLPSLTVSCRSDYWMFHTNLRRYCIAIKIGGTILVNWCQFIKFCHAEIPDNNYFVFSMSCSIAGLIFSKHLFAQNLSNLPAMNYKSLFLIYTLFFLIVPKVMRDRLATSGTKGTTLKHKKFLNRKPSKVCW